MKLCLRKEEGPSTLDMLGSSGVVEESLQVCVLHFLRSLWKGLSLLCLMADDSEEA